MAKSIKLTDPSTGTTYTLEFDRDAVVYAERIGFDITKASTAYATDTVALFRAAFHKNHQYVTDAVIDGIWDRLPGKSEVMQVLIEMFVEPYNALLSEPGDGDPKETPTFQVVG